MAKLPLWKITVFVLAALTMLLAIVWALQVAPPDSKQGDVQRIFYFHLGSIWPGFAAFFYVLYASVRYLVSRDLKWDDRAISAGEIGFMFCTMVLVTGPIWAKPTWGVWWAWDARLTSTLVLWIVYLAYTNLRHYIDDPAKRPRVSAVLGIVGACMVPFVYMSTRIYETQHPGPVIMGDEDAGIKDPAMQQALMLALAAFSFLTVTLFQRGVELRASSRRLDVLQGKLRDLTEEEWH